MPYSRLSDKIPENYSEKNTSTSTSTLKECRYCFQKIHNRAEVCNHCQRHQISFWNHFKIEQIGLLISVIMLIVAFSQLKEARQERIDAENALLKAKSTEARLLTLSQNTLKYAFYIVDPFNGVASTGGAHGRGVAFETSTDLSDLMGKARNFINSDQYGIALQVANKIDQKFPGFLGGMYISFLAYKGMGDEDRAIEYANKIIEQISGFGFSDLNVGVADVYRFVINKNIENNKRDDAIENAKNALMFWPDDEFFINIVN